MVAKFNTSRVSQVMVEQVPQEDISKFGIADLDGASIALVNQLKSIKW